MEWFGESWGAPVNEDCEEVPVPVGSLCLRCDVAITAGDQGVVMPYLPPLGEGDVSRAWEKASYHLDCLLQSIGGPGCM